MEVCKVPPIKRLQAVGVTLKQYTSALHNPANVVGFFAKRIEPHVLTAMQESDNGNILIIALSRDGTHCEGFASFLSEGNVLQLTGLYVAAGWRSQGIASWMIRRAQALTGYEYISCPRDFPAFTHPTYCVWQGVFRHLLLTTGFRDFPAPDDYTWIKPIHFYTSSAGPTIRLPSKTKMRGGVLHHVLMPVAVTDESLNSTRHYTVNLYRAKIDAREICRN